jgi:hypothetical protein
MVASQLCFSSGMGGGFAALGHAGRTLLLMLVGAMRAAAMKQSVKR